MPLPAPWTSAAARAGNFLHDIRRLDRLYKTADYVDAMRAAAKTLRSVPSRAASNSSPN
jgi:hypothetical protein